MKAFGAVGAVLGVLATSTVHVAKAQDLRLGYAVEATGWPQCGTYVAITGHKAMKDVNARRDHLCPAIADLQETFTMGMEMMDGVDNSKGIIRGGLKLLGMTNWAAGGTTFNRVHGIVGPNWSGNSKESAPFFAVFDMPLVSQTATSGSLSDKDRYPNFFRAIAPDPLKLTQMFPFVDGQMKYKELIVIHVPTGFAEDLAIGVQNAARLLDIELQKEVINHLDPAEITAKLELLQKSSVRAFVLCGVSVETGPIIEKARELGMLSGNDEYFWMHPEPLPSEDKWQGIFTISPDTASMYVDRQRAEWSTYSSEPDLIDYLAEARCGEEQDTVCNSLEGSGIFVTDTLANFDLCVDYGPMGYDAVVLYAVAFDIGLREGLFTKSTVDSAGLMAALKLMKKGEKYGDGQSYGRCLAPGGPLGFDENQERSATFLITQVQPKTGGTAGEFAVYEMGKSTLENTFALATSEEAKNALWGYSSDGTVLKGWDRVPLGHVKPCTPGFFMEEGACRKADPGYHAPDAGMTSQRECLPGFFSDAAGATECSGCPKGSYQDASGQTACLPCAAGTFAPGERTTACTSCAKGTFAEAPGAASCANCALGSFQDAEGATTCNLCPKGQYSNREGEVRCVLCELGAEQQKEGQTSCNSCALGTFAAELGTSKCSSCLDIASLMTTQGRGSPSAAHCICPKGFFKDVTSGTCEKCTEGLFCPQGSDAGANLGVVMKVRPGYWAESAEKILDVYQCDTLVMTDKRGSHEDPEGYVEDDSEASSRCPGPKGNECPAGRVGKLCGKCKDGWYKSEGGCKSCSGAGGNTPVAVVVVLGVLLVGPALAHRLLNANAMEQSGILMFQMALGILLTTTQLGSLVTKLALKWPAWVNEFFEILSALALNLEVLPFACATGSDDGVSRYAVLVLVVPLVCGWIFAWMAISRMVFKKGNPNHMELADAVNVFGQCYQSLFVLIVVWVVAPFRDFGHPSSSLESVRHVVSYPDTQVGTADHGTMIGLAAFAFLAYAVSFIVFYAWQIVSMPDRAKKSEEERMKILRGLRFIFLRFRPENWYWGGVLIFRNFLCSCVAFLPPESTFAQPLYLFCILQIYFAMQVRKWPWHSHELNTVDAVQSLSILGMVACCFALAGQPIDESATDAAVTTVIVFYVMGAAFVISWISWALFNYQIASRSSATVTKEMTRVGHCLEELQSLQKCLANSSEADLYAALKDMDVDDIVMTRNMCSKIFALGGKLKDSSAEKGPVSSKSGTRRLEVFHRGITSPGRALHIHYKKHGQGNGEIAKTLSANFQSKPELDEHYRMTAPLASGKPGVEAEV